MRMNRVYERKPVGQSVNALILPKLFARAHFLFHLHSSHHQQQHQAKVWSFIDLSLLRIRHVWFCNEDENYLVVSL